ncbi:uncharacterized protein LOC130510467 [Raphanus sativus]|uniref:Uncharacterized protein LOC108849995 n=1 Tax=Raphanus sativus TaxID=3726 RepID=A0A9W3DFW1_RAPSA|nr:uncharacterized protein LOC108849995 [Raphanus sativus]XP_056862781.1 uncharacterized protein LOC130510467 [Raphanus sativus]
MGYSWIKGADELGKFRPVSCCTTVYKVIASLLKKKLKLFVSDVVQRNQVGFLKDRLLCENVLLASELVTGFHKRGPLTRGCLKIDITKAFDNLHWSFVLNALRALDLPDVFLNWIKECITTPTFSVAFNGELVGCFAGKRGLRQGDPISSLLFVLAMDTLSKKLDAGAIEGKFGLHPQCDAPLITHLSFADDVLIFFDGSEASLVGILEILEEFKKVSGLGINLSKSEVFFDGGNSTLVQDVVARLHLKQGSLPVRYLGVPLTTRKLRKQDYQPLLDNLSARFTSWTVRHLSFAGRIELLKSVIYAVISFWATIFILPNQCLKKLEQMCNSFLWKGTPGDARGAKVRWDSVCSLKSSGGLGLRKLKPWNQVLGLKLIWLIFTASGSLWVSWIRRHLIGNQDFWTLDSENSGSWIWKQLCKLRPLARRFVYCQLGSGITARFWHDNWTGNGALIDLTGPLRPQIAGLDLGATVADGIIDGNWWLHRSRSRNPIICLLRDSLPPVEPIALSEVDDLYLWKIGTATPSTSFNTAATWSSAFPPPPLVNWHKSVWFSGSIPKHAFITWLISLNRLSTRDRLGEWGLDVPSSCLLCSMFDENRQHLFFDCDYSKEVWSFFSSKAHLTPPLSFEDCLRWMKDPTTDRNVNLILKLAFQASCYAIWKERNTRLHSAVSRSAQSLIADIRLTIRSKLDSLSRAQRNLQTTVSFLSTCCICAVSLQG